MSNSLIIGLCGTNGAGKTSVANYLESKGYERLSFSGIIDAELKKEGVEITRESQVKKGNQLRTDFGSNEIAKRLAEKIKGPSVLESFRNPEEVNYFKQFQNFILVAVDAPAELRFERVGKRGRNESAATFEEFVARENKERSTSPHAQQLDVVMKMADFAIIDDGTIEEEQRKVDSLLEKLQKKKDDRKRASWDHYFMNIAKEVATRATCDRKHVGAVIARDKMILSTGYNGSLRGLDHCDTEGHLMEGGHCVRTVHAEANAIVQAARNGVNIDGATIYTTASPCWPCFKLIGNSGIKRICFGEFYRDEKIHDFSEKMNIELVDLSQDVQE